MDNGALVFIIIIEAIVIVWLASKLKQYQKFEHLLSPAAGGSAANSSGKASSATPMEQTPVSSVSPDKANAATQAVSNSVSASQDTEEELLDMPGVDPEDNIEEAKRVQLVMARCRYAEFYLEQLDDDYELGQFQRIVKSCKNTARNIEDPFFRASALQPIVMLLHRAEMTRQRDQLLEEVDDELVRQRITDELAVSGS